MGQSGKSRGGVPKPRPCSTRSSTVGKTMVFMLRGVFDARSVAKVWIVRSWNDGGSKLEAWDCDWKET